MKLSVHNVAAPNVRVCHPVPVGVPVLLGNPRRKDIHAVHNLGRPLAIKYDTVLKKLALLIPLLSDRWRHHQARTERLLHRREAGMLRDVIALDLHQDLRGRVLGRMVPVAG